MSNPTIQFHGRLTRDPVQMESMTKFSVAVDKDKDGTMYFNCASWGSVAKFVAQYLKKGALVIVSGKFAIRDWEKDGKKGTSLDVSVDHLDSVKTEKKSDADDTGLPANFPWESK